MFGAFDVKRLDAVNVRMGLHISMLCHVLYCVVLCAQRLAMSSKKVPNTGKMCRFKMKYELQHIPAAYPYTYKNGNT